MSVDRAELLLARLCQSARAQPDPLLNVSSIEDAVKARVARSTVDSLVVPSARTGRHLWAAAAMVAAAAFGFVAFQLFAPGATPEASSERGRLTLASAMNGSLLAPNQVLEARDHDLTVKHAGVAVWQLRAPGRIRVIENGARISVALERGRIEAEVVPQKRPEVFAVEIEQIRVAVHGTVFSVERQGDSAHVTVKEGSVRLGASAQRGATQGQLLIAPAHIRINVRPAAAPEEANVAGEAPPRAMHAGGGKPAPSARNASNPREPVLPQRPTSRESERIWATVAQRISQCFASQTGGDPNVRVSFGTQISIRLTPEGTVVVDGFNPPVPQPVNDCSQRELSQLSTPRTVEGAVLSRPSVLSR